MPVQIQMAQPADLAGEYTRGVQTGAQIKQAQDRLQAQQEEANSRLREESQRLAERQAQQQQEHAVQQQRIQVTAAYNNEKAALRKQQLDQVAAVNAEKTRAAAQSFSARQQWNAGMQAIDADTTLDEAAKDKKRTQFTMRMAPNMGMPGTEAASLLREMRPQKPTVPASVIDKGDFLQVTQPNGSIAIHPKPKQATPHDPLVKVQLTDGVPPTSMPQSQARQVIPSLPDELKTNAVNQAVMRASGTSSGAKVRVRHPNGQIGTIDAEKLEGALKAGYTRLE